MYYRITYKSGDDTNTQSAPLWMATVNSPDFNPENPDALCATREDALKVFSRIKPNRDMHHIKLFECDSYTGFDWAFGKEITPDR